MVYNITSSSQNDFEMKAIRYILIFISRELPTFELNYLANSQIGTRGQIPRSNLRRQHGPPHSDLLPLPFEIM